MSLVQLDRGASQHEILARVARLLPVRSFLEVGVRDGATLWAVLEAGRGTCQRLALCDDWGTAHGGTGRGSHDHVLALLQAIGYFRPGGQVEWLDERSQIALPRLVADGRAFDLVHIDGDHSEQSVLEDLLNGWQLLRLGGYLVAHDANYAPVGRALQRFSAQTGAMVDVHHTGRGTAVVRRELL